MNKVLKDHLPKVMDLFKSHKVKKAYAFGSVVTGPFNDLSDIDLIISFDKSLDPIEYGELYFDLADKLEALLERKVDLITEPTLRNPYFLENVNKSKILLYE